MILVDTSAWIEFFRGRDPVAAKIDRLLVDDEVAICGPIVAELRRGLRDQGERRQVLPLLEGCHTLPTPLRLWEEAGELGFALGRRGATLKSMDLLIATFALTHDVGLLAVDRDFARMRTAGLPLRLVEA